MECINFELFTISRAYWFADADIRGGASKSSRWGTRGAQHPGVRLPRRPQCEWPPERGYGPWFYCAADLWGVTTTGGVFLLKKDRVEKLKCDCDGKIFEKGTFD